ncbi:hypothetical protein JKA74_12170 [Marivirga sp. S37H4]|uniref:Uncharacterized protein n=1 Tax=Marivirga aurantiaca TaxID=2802615 RepID=A0A934WZJ8_9BACT|nr:SO2930 family diheme c-type cytochrome [Marivirga aurantiaca]MBK6265791.1 hypothetical protein [Marivirga aurantiaca]
MLKSIYILILILFFASCQNPKPNDQQKVETDNPPVIKLGGSKQQSFGLEKLSDYALFQGELAKLNPANGVVPYDLNSPLFSDYAFKARFVKIPEGKTATYHSTEVLEFPVGTVLIKNFYYPTDFNRPKGTRTILETRLLIHEENGWKALPYVWNEEQTEAYLEITGDTKSISWRDTEGNQQQLMYNVPNVNQCRSCHLLGDKIKPIGPSARQLNKDYNYEAHKELNQLVHWQETGMLENLPSGELPKMVSFQNKNAPLAERARAYLEINCGHCHRPEGPAKNSALNLMVSEENPAAWGVEKTPIAAGKGSGGLKYDIVPGHPEQSILVFRMESTDPGIMMPELGRKMVDKEGLELVKEWIASMK